VQALFDGSHSDQDVMKSLLPSVQQLLTSRFLSLLRHPAGRLAQALRANSTCTGWTLASAARIYAAAGDRTVPRANAQHCQHDLRQHGRDVRLVGLGDVDHDVSDFVALPEILTWFGQWR
jgi:hypothetical protein